MRMLYWPRLLCIVHIARVAVCCLMLNMAGCSTFAKTDTDAPKATAKVIEEHTNYDAQGKPTGKTVTTKTGESTGTGTHNLGDKLDQNMSAQPASVTVDGVSATGGGGDSHTKASGAPMEGTRSPLLYVGILCMLIGIAGFFYAPLKMVALPGIAAGITFIACAFYPWILLWGVLALVFIIGGPYIIAAMKGQKSYEALRAVVGAVSAAPESVASSVKDEIAKQAEPRDIDTITAVKRRDGLK